MYVRLSSGECTCTSCVLLFEIVARVHRFSPIARTTSDNFYLRSLVPIPRSLGNARERERMLAERWTVIALYYSKVIGAEYREALRFLFEILFVQRRHRLFRKLAGRKQIGCSHRVHGNRRVPPYLYRIHIHANNCNNV